MPVMENLCPRCGARPHGATPPTEDEILTCDQCGFLGIWDVHYWRTPTADERRSLLSHREIVNAQFLPIVGTLCTLADEQRMIEILRKRLRILLLGTGVTESSIIDLFALVAEDLRTAGFHTHRAPIELKDIHDDR